MLFAFGTEETTSALPQFGEVIFQIFPKVICLSNISFHQLRGRREYDAAGDAEFDATNDAGERDDDKLYHHNISTDPTLTNGR